MSVSSLLDGKVAVVTGGSQGLGFATSAQLALYGARVCILDLDMTKTEASIELLPGDDHLGLCCDVTKSVDREAAVSRVCDYFGRIDILVNNAGIQLHRDADQMDEELWNSVVNVNLNAVMFMSRDFGRVMIRQKQGSIVNIGSISSFFGMPRRSVYVATKTAVLGLTRALASEWGRHNVRVNVVCPGYHETPMFQEYVENGTLIPDKIIGRIPMERLGTPEDVGKAVVLLCSPLAEYINGQSLIVDGGYTISGAPQ